MNQLPVCKRRHRGLLCAMTLIPVMAKPEPAAKPLYTCPMHPEVISDKPGLCPKCEMDLVPVKSK